MEPNKLPHSVALMGLSWILTAIAWFSTHVAVIAGVAAIVASLFTGLASWETFRLRREERKRLQHSRAHRPPPRRQWWGRKE